MSLPPAACSSSLTYHQSIPGGLPNISDAHLLGMLRQRGRNGGNQGGMHTRRQEEAPPQGHSLAASISLRRMGSWAHAAESGHGEARVRAGGGLLGGEQSGGGGQWASAQCQLSPVASRSPTSHAAAGLSPARTQDGHYPQDCQLSQPLHSQSGRARIRPQLAASRSLPQL